MDKQEKKSKWDDLARQLGAEIPPEQETAEVAKESIEVELSSMSVSSFQEPPAAKPRPATPKRVTPGWEQLSRDLGLPPLEPPPAEAPSPVSRQQTAPPDEWSPPPVVSTRRPDEAPSDVERSDVEREAEPNREESQGSSDRERGRRGGRGRGGRGGRGRGRRDERGDEGQRGPRGNRQEGGQRQEGGERGRREQREQRPPREEREPRGERQPRDDRNRRTYSEYDVEETSASLHEEEISISRQEPKPEPAPESEPKPSISLWHKIFGLPAEQAAKISEPTPPRSETYETADSSESAIAPAVRDFDPADAESGLSDRARDTDSGRTDDDTREPDSDDRGRRRPRRRGRGRGRGERSDRDDRSARPRERTESSRNVHTQPHEDDFDTLDDEEPDDDLSAALDSDDDGPLDADDDDAGVSATSSGADRVAGHRSIPSWSEAIGMIVDTNLQARPQRGRSHSGSRPGPPRGGRGRGGRGGRRRPPRSN